MKYIITGLLLIAFTGCGSSDNDKKEVIVQQEPETKSEVIKETSPQNMEKAKTPPAIPNI